MDGQTPRVGRRLSVLGLRGRIALIVAHFSGKAYLVALPVWVGTLVAAFKFHPISKRRSYPVHETH